MSFVVIVVDLRQRDGGDRWVVGGVQERHAERKGRDGSELNYAVDVSVKILAKASRKRPADGKDGRLFLTHGRTVKVRCCKGEGGDSRRTKKSGRDRESWEEVGGRSGHNESHETVGTWDGGSWSFLPGSDEESEKREDGFTGGSNSELDLTLRRLFTSSPSPSSPSLHSYQPVCTRQEREGMTVYPSPAPSTDGDRVKIPPSRERHGPISLKRSREHGREKNFRETSVTRGREI